MVRPQASAKRKAVGKAAGGRLAAAAQAQAQQPPAKRHRGKLSDVYEAEEPELDEVKHAARYDNVENYEFEMPSDYEDEEIDEDMAFTAEDKLKYGDMFGDKDEEGSPEEDEGEDVQDGSSDADLDLLDSDQELQEAVEGEASEDEEDELRQLGDDDEEAGEDAEGQEDSAAEDDHARHQAMLASVIDPSASALAQTRQAGKQKPQLISEAYPESEFSLNPGAASAGTAGELTLADLMQGLGGEGRKKLPVALRKQLDKMSAKPQVVPAPLPRTIKERTERQAGYETTAKDVAKWQTLVKANREAPSLQFTTARDDVPRITTTAAIVAQHTPDTIMEAEVAALLAAAGAASAQAVAAAEEALSTKALTLDEARERRARLAKMRSLLFYHELKARRLKGIKSKDHHRRVAKAAKRKSGREGEEGGANDEEQDDAVATERAEREMAEVDRAKERLTLKHRNTSRWVRRALKRGTMMDEGTKEAVAEQLRLGQALRRRIEGGRPDSDSGSDGGSSESDGDDEDGEGNVAEPGAGTSGRSMGSKAKAMALDILSDPTAETAPAKGLFALPFMARALQRKRQAAVHDAEAALQEMVEEEGGEAVVVQASTAGRQRFGGQPSSAGVDSDGASDRDNLQSDEDEDVEAKAARLQQRIAGSSVQVAAGVRTGKAQQGVHAPPSAADNEDLDRALASLGGRVSHSASMAVLAPGVASAASHHEAQQQPQPQARQGKPSQQGHGQAGPGVQPQHTQQACPPFTACLHFQGARPGQVFTTGTQGVGYYTDVAPQPLSLQEKQSKRDTKASKQQQQQQAVAGVPAVRIAGTNTAPIGGRGGTRAAAEQAEPPADFREDDSDADNNTQGHHQAREGMRPAPSNKSLQQRDLVAMAFAGDDVEADFTAAKTVEVQAELPVSEVLSALPGWGAWVGQQRDPKWMRDARARAEREREKAAAGRADSGLAWVVLSEKWDKKAMSKYAVQQVPFPFSDRETYERSIRQPLGKQFNADSAFRDLTRPAILKHTGVMIEPIRYSKPLARQAGEVTGRSSKPKVLTVAGGVLKKAKKT